MPTKPRLGRYERATQPVASRGRFVARLTSNTLVALVLIGFSLAGGMAGYHLIEGLAWIDAFANAAMILSGMGPLAAMTTYDGKLFAGLYALYSGLLLIFVSSLILAPVVHRVLHHLHVQDGD